MVDTNTNMQALFKGFYKDKTVLVTGHTGFKGSWLTMWLKVLGAKVIGYSLEPPTNPNLFELAGVSDGIGHNIADIRDYDKLLYVVRSTKPEIVFHLAAQPIVRRGYAEPRLTYETNVMGTVNLLEAIRQTSSVRVCVNITSDKCYKNKGLVYSYYESDPMGGNDPYSSSKGCAELVASAYRRSFFNPEKYASHRLSLVSMRAGNVIGGGDWAQDRIIPDCIKALSNNKPLKVRNPTSIRPWQYVLDPVSSYLWIGALLWQNPEKYDYAWNIGPVFNASMTVEQVVETVIKFWGGGEWEDISDRENPHEANCLRLDCSKAADILRWHSCYDINQTIEATIKWYHRYYQDTDFNAAVFSLEQIEEYVRQAKGKELDWALE